MNKREYHFQFEEYPSAAELSPEDAGLLELARNSTQTAYAPYSGFRVGAAALMENGEIVTGSNQENASYPVGICAERALLAVAGTRFPDVPIQSMAVSYDSGTSPGNKPITPCGMCRQALQEFEERTGKPVRLILSGLEGPVFLLRSSSLLLPLAFTKRELKK